MLKTKWNKGIWTLFLTISQNIPDIRLIPLDHVTYCLNILHVQMYVSQCVPIEDYISAKKGMLFNTFALRDIHEGCYTPNIRLNHILCYYGKQLHEINPHFPQINNVILEQICLGVLFLHYYDIIIIIGSSFIYHCKIF